MSDPNESETCVNCQLANALTEWRDAGGAVEDVVEAVRELVNAMVYAALDEVFEDADEPVDMKAAH